MAIMRIGPAAATRTQPWCTACRALAARKHQSRGIASFATAEALSTTEAGAHVPNARTRHAEPGGFLTQTVPTKQGGKLPKHYFQPSNRASEESTGPSSKPPDPDENRANLGRTLRILQDRLPTLLQSPLQQDLLAPNISLHLFPSTHPHLPTVSGRVAYTAALWTSPIAWNRVPVIGNVKLTILSARVTREPVPGEAPLRSGAVPEKLVVRWCTCGAPGGDHRHAQQPRGAGEGEQQQQQQGGRHFAGLFIFQFDRQGRILSHTIETVEGGGDWERGVGAKVVGVADWLLGGLGRGEPSPAFERVEHRRDDTTRRKP